MFSLILKLQNRIRALVRKVRKKGIVGTFKLVKEEMTILLSIPYLLYLKLCKSKNGLVLKEILGNKMYLSISDQGLSRELLLRGIREELQTKTLKRIVTPGMTIVEVGANLGYYVLLEASLIGEKGRIYAIEPIPQNFEILVKNININNYSHIVEPYCFAISDRCGVSEMAMTKSSNFSTMFLDENKASDWMSKALKKNITKNIEVKTLTLDKFLENKRTPDLIRMDVEGYEIEIFKGMRRILGKREIPLKLFLEVHPSVFKDVSIMAQFIRDLINLNFEPLYLINTQGTKFLEFTTENLPESVCKEHAPALFLERRNSS